MAVLLPLLKAAQKSGRLKLTKTCCTKIPQIQSLLICCFLRFLRATWLQLKNSMEHHSPQRLVFECHAVQIVEGREENQTHRITKLRKNQISFSASDTTKLLTVISCENEILGSDSFNFCGLFTSSGKRYHILREV